MKKLGIGLVGYKFMGKAHSNAYLKAGKFFKLKAEPVMKVICGRNEKAVKEVAENWGWQEYCTDYREILKRDDIDVIDITSPNAAHCEMAVEAAKAGKHILLEKPMAMNADEARRMVASIKKAGVKNMIWFNYRRCPAIGLAKRLIEEGRLGRIFHFRGAYLQDWIIDPEFPLVWRLRKEVSGSGAHGDLNAHIIDLAQYLVGDIAEVVGMTETFIKERPIEGEGSTKTLTKSGKVSKIKKKGRVTVDDACLFLARFAGGTIGSFEATRFAQGRKNGERIEINGEKGSIAFNFERMNELEYFDARQRGYEQGFRTILATNPAHPYMKAWWPPGHIIGYEHAFINQLADAVNGIASGKELRPNFEDGLKNQKVLDAVLISAKKKQWVKVSSM